MSRKALSLALACAALAVGATALPAEAEAAAPVSSFSVTPQSVEAGGHGDLLVRFGFDLSGRPDLPCKCNRPKDITVNTPAGLLGFPTSIPRCTLAQFATKSCPTDSQVGVAATSVGNPALNTAFALFNMTPSPEQAALLAFEFPFTPTVSIFTSFTVRTESDFGLEAKTFGVLNAPSQLQLREARVIFWGTPGDPAHEALRFPFGGYGEDAVTVFPDSYQIRCIGSSADWTAQLWGGINPLREPDGACAAGDGDPPTVPYNAAVEPFLTNPTNCTGALEATIDVLAYDEEHAFATAPFAAPDGITGCENLSFDPSLAGKPTTTRAESPSGLDVELKVPVPSSPEAPSPSQIRGTKMVLPEGFAVNSNAADGKSACTNAEARFGTREAAQCPESAKIGTLAIHSASLPGALPGAFYLGEPLPGNRYRVFLVADGFSLHIKLEGRLELDPVSGQATTIFEDLPQAPFQRFNLHLFGGERGPLTTPTHCGRYPVRTTFTPWDNALPEQTSTQFFSIDSGPGGGPCPPSPRPFEPSFQAGASPSTAGEHTNFIVDLGRDDGEQNLAGLEVKVPRGFSADLKGIPYCPEAAIAQLSSPLYSGVAELASPICAASQIGTVSAGAGAGSRPFYAPGAVYLAGPYRSAPLSLLVVVPAVSGPYDLGNVAVRAKIDVDPVTAEVSTTTDPLPQILEGIPLRARSILTRVDKENFARNPTNCSALSSEADVAGDEGASVHRSTHFQVSNCANLGFEPRLFLRLRGGTKRGAHPGLRAVLMPRSGDANIAFASVALPRSEFLENAHIRTICTRAQFASRTCPEGAIYGNAVAHTPILDEPLRGPVYLRSSSNLLPDLVMDLRGQVDFNAIGRIDTVNGGIRSTFDFIPDIPVSKVILRMQGGNKGLLVNSRDVCKGSPKATARYRGQNNARYSAKVPLKANCAKQRKAKRSPKHSRKARVLRARSVR